MLFTTHNVLAQEVRVELAALDGLELRPDNAFGFSVVNGTAATKNVRIKGTLKFKGSPLEASYAFSTSVAPGTTVLNRERAGYPDWQTSNAALRELFLTYGKLPQGTYEYCVELTVLDATGGEVAVAPVDDCIYQSVEDVFLINLVEPEDGAKIYEYHPMLSWIVNYPFAAELTYRVRVVEIKRGQNTANAIARNNPIYQERGVAATTMTYPVTARPLQAWQPYAWTVDAYYKGLLLGGAEPWRFTIIEDSVLAGLPKETYHIDIRKENNASGIYAIGKAKIKYELLESRKETLAFSLATADGTPVKLSPAEIPISEGDNRLEIDLTSTAGVRHLQRYVLTIRDRAGHLYTLPFRYVNPDYLP